MTTLATDRVIVESGLYDDLPADIYHRDPVPAGSLSCSGAKKLLPPSCPAIFDWERKNPPASTKTLDIGTAAHKLVLGSGPEIVIVEADDWRTKAAQQARALAQLSGAIALLRKEYEPILGMVEALRKHPVASRLLDPEHVRTEVSAFFVDQQSGVTRRCRYDALRMPNGSGRTIIPDYKTAASADKEKFAKAAADYGYHQQQAWYVDAAIELEIAEDPAFLFVVQEKTPPYLINVVQLDATAERIGRLLNRQAIDIYAECTSTGVWPGYGTDVAHVSLPQWFERQFEEEL